MAQPRVTAGIRGTEEIAKVIGDKELIKELKKLNASVQRKVMRPAINFGLTPIRQETARRAPRDTGLLSKSIKKKVGKRGAWGKVYVDSQTKYQVETAGNTVNKRVGAKSDEKGIQNPAKYAHLVEFGTKHSRSKPFMRPAMESKKGIAYSRIARKAKERINKLAKKDIIR